MSSTFWNDLNIWNVLRTVRRHEHFEKSWTFSTMDNGNVWYVVSHLLCAWTFLHHRRCITVLRRKQNLFKFWFQIKTKVKFIYWYLRDNFRVLSFIFESQSKYCAKNMILRKGVRSPCIGQIVPGWWTCHRRDPTGSNIQKTLRTCNTPPHSHPWTRF